jgi:ABC-type bacteriocin/lantibiotic exporter with double-glycine peptidase domain
MIRNAPILILDEPTSSLDAAAEALTLEALERLRRGRTTFIIAHRLSTVRKADQTVVLEGGRIVERGTHEDLVAYGSNVHPCLAQLGERKLAQRDEAVAAAVRYDGHAAIRLA